MARRLRISGRFFRTRMLTLGGVASILILLILSSFFVRTRGRSRSISCGRGARVAED